MPGTVGPGYRFNSFIALGSSRLAGILLPGNGSRTEPLAAAMSPVTGSARPLVTARVVAGSRIVPVGITRPRLSVRVPDCPAIRSWKLVYPLALSAAVGTVG